LKINRRKHITMFSWLFGKRSEQPNTLATLEELNEKLKILEKREQFLLEKMAAEIEKAKEFTRENNKRGEHL
ncbi:hypothetical protein BHM03_00033751, partial [Ensete ventricosum]